MKVLIVGGGPAGLYCGLLMKKADPSREVTVVERNPADATYGWGVVFSERTLGALADADTKTARAITERFVQWDVIDIRYRDAALRCGGQVFAGISRKTLLAILQRRCDELGVRLRFRTEVADLPGRDEADVVVAADGVNSAIRQRLARWLRPTIREGRCRYIWYGTDRWLDAFTFVFRENAAGLFQVHAYPFDGTTGTFIVECDEPVWRRAGLDRMDEAESIAYCRELFAPELGGRRLLSNHSRWIRFGTLVTARWWHDRVVLLGDAAHTAHFSIGSGTKLAMEDAIALARAFEHHRDLDAAFADYEMSRRPVVEAFQQAAGESQAYFEDLRRYLHMDPPQFAFHLLSRSGRMTYDALQVRDPHFVDRVNRWFAAAAAAAERSAPGPVVAPPPMLAPLRLRGLELANRVVLAAGPGTAEGAGIPGPAFRRRVADLAMVGPGLILTGPVAVEPDGRITPASPGFYSEAQRDAWAGVAASIRERSAARLAVTLNHSGPRGATRPRAEGLDRPLREGAWPLVAASTVPYAPWSALPRAMDRGDMDRVRDAFARAAGFAAAAGVHMLVLQFGHGYLLATFLSPLTNRRDDAWGGTLEGRLRFPLEVLDAVRAAWPADRPLAVAFTADDCARGGLAREDAVEAARRFQARGADLLIPLAGQTIPDAGPAYGRGFLTPLADLVRNEARVPVLLAGYLVTTDEVNTALAAGRADLCLVDPPHLRARVDQESRTTEPKVGTTSR
ncbi:MAG: FAD-dependent monooxygenase [Armatimonadota bacterium]|nr:FAD-dependent monooxygenase [Armatimonadota bacterium]MDR7454272.1 FAD-dependent monooxygenase [Armatimonadota bacterium]